MAKVFVISVQFMKITKIFDLENLELYGRSRNLYKFKTIGVYLKYKLSYMKKGVFI